MPLRSFGMASKSDLQKEIWLQALLGTEALGTFADTMPPCILVDTAGDYAVTQAHVLPHLFTTLRNIQVLIECDIGAANMKFDARAWYARSGACLWTSYGGGTVNVTLVAGRSTLVDVTAAIGGMPLLAGDIIAVRLSYNAAATATDCRFHGARLRWW